MRGNPWIPLRLGASILVGVWLLTPEPTLRANPAKIETHAVASVAESEPLSLTWEDVLARVLQQSLRLNLRRIDPMLARAEMLIARGAFDPRLNFGLSYGEISQPRLAEQVAADGALSVQSRNLRSDIGLDILTPLGTDLALAARLRNTQTTFNAFDDQFDTFAGLTIRQPLLKNFGVETNLAPLRIAIAREAQAQFEVQFLIETLAVEAHRLFTEVNFLRADLEARRQSKALAERLRRDNQARVELGVMTRMDVVQAEAEEARLEASILRTTQNLHEQENELRRLIARDVRDILHRPLVLQQPPLPAAIPKPTLNAIYEAFARRYDYQALLAEAQQRGLELKVARNQSLPQLNLEGSLGYAGLGGTFTRSWDRLFNLKDDDWSVGIRLAVPWNGQAERGRVQRAELEQDRVFLRLKQLEQDIVIEINNAAHALENTQQRIKAARRARAAAEETLAAEEEKLRAGVSTSFTVLQMQRDLIAARTEELRAEADYRNAIIAYQRALGNLLPYLGIQLEPL